MPSLLPSAAIARVLAPLARVAALGCALAVVSPSAAEARPGTPPASGRPAAVMIDHVVQPGQFLSMIAKRYHTTSGAIRKTNRLAPSAALKPGMTLRIEETREHAAWRQRAEPERQDGGRKGDDRKGDDRKGDDRKGKEREGEDRKGKEREGEDRKGSDRKGDDRKGGDRRGKEREGEDEPRSHRNHGRTVDERPASRANADRWAKRPLRPGYVTFLRMNESFRGQLRAPNGTILPKSAERLDHLMRSHATDERMKIDRRLMKLIAQVSDHFGGRALLAVSGFRPYSPRQYTKNSRHNHGQALDFRVDGVPNLALFEYCLTLPQVGCGYYPNSVFVHMDVREQKTRWVDYSGPGEAPVYGRPKPASRPAAGGVVEEPEPDEDDPEPDED